MTRTRRSPGTGKIPLSQMVSVPPKAYPSTNIETDSIKSIENYMPGASTVEIIERFSAGLRGAKSGRLLSITGPYGSGKSTMVAFLGALLSPRNSAEWKAAHRILKKEPPQHEHALVYARKKSGIHETGMIKCMVAARNEPISSTLIRALDSGLSEYYGRYTKKHFASAGELRKRVKGLGKGRPDPSGLVEIIGDVAGARPLLIVIDEFGKNIEFFASDESREGDLHILQELAEMSGRKAPLSIVTLQHMAFDEYAAGASMAHRREWAKIQGRFEDILFANSPDQTRQMVFNMIKPSRDPGARARISRWAKTEHGALQDLGMGAGYDPGMIAACYPLSPLSLEMLPELCSRYGQNERTLMSFLSDGTGNTVAAFISENTWNDRSPPRMGPDILYDYFISDMSLIHSNTLTGSRLMEINTIIRDIHGLGPEEMKALKTIGMLNLAGSGGLRASRRLLDYAMGGDAGPHISSLEKKSAITYRKYADEYRVWHGTDIDITAKLGEYRARYKRMPLMALLEGTVSLEPVVGVRHGIRTGTMRVFERRLAGNAEELGEFYDGVMLYGTGEKVPKPSHGKPVLVVTARNTAELKKAAVEASAIRDVLETDEDVSSDRVARRELEERLSDATLSLEMALEDAYGGYTRWSGAGGMSGEGGSEDALVSSVCDKVYPDTPSIRNEMINRTTLSAQGSAAKRKVLEAMIERRGMPRLGIEGYGADRAVYEAVLAANKIHVSTQDGAWGLKDPGESIPACSAMLERIKKARGRICLSDVYETAKRPPYGVKDGPVQLLAVAIILSHEDDIAVYEHGTYVPRLKPEITERMTKNPGYFELKYFEGTPAKNHMLKCISEGLKTRHGGVLDVVSHLVGIVSALHPHIRSTRRLGRDVLAVRDAILEATEPDTLVFETLPSVLGFKAEMSRGEAGRFSRRLASAAAGLQGGFEEMLSEMENMLYEYTGTADRARLSGVAAKINSEVTEQRMKMFLTALTADTLERREDWLNYVAMSLTDVPPSSWTDVQRGAFESNLRTAASTFKRLAGMRFASVSDGFAGQSYHLTVTHADGSEHNSILTVRPEQRKKLGAFAEKVFRQMKKDGLTTKDMSALVALLSSRLQ